MFELPRLNPKLKMANIAAKIAFSVAALADIAGTIEAWSRHNFAEQQFASIVYGELAITAFAIGALTYAFQVIEDRKIPITPRGYFGKTIRLNPDLLPENDYTEPPIVIDGYFRDE